MESDTESENSEVVCYHCRNNRLQENEEETTQVKWINEEQLLWEKSGHQALVADSVAEMFSTGDFSDVSIAVDGTYFLCHRLILSIASQYFYRMFTSSMKEKSMKEITLPNLNKSVFKDILQFIYYGNVTVNRDNVQGLLHASDMLLLDDLKQGCVTFYERFISVDNCIGIWRFSVQCNAPSLANNALQFSLKNFTDVQKHNREFVDLDYDDFCYYISHQDLIVEIEQDTCRMFIQWLEHYVDNRKQYIMTVLPKLRLLTQSPRSIKQILLDNCIIQNNPEAVLFLQQVINHILYYESLPHNFILQPVRTYSTYPYTCVIMGGYMEGRKTRQCHISKYNDNNQSISSSPAGNVPTQFNIETASCVADDIIFLAGCGENCDELWKFDLNRTVWIKCKNLKEGRICHSMVSGARVDQCVYVIGGYNESTEQVLGSVEVHHIQRNITEKLCDMYEATACCAVQYYSGIIYMFGGVTDEDRPCNWIQTINPDTQQCTLVPLKLPTAALRLKSFICVNQLIIIGSNISYIVDMPKLHSLASCENSTGVAGYQENIESRCDENDHFRSLNDNENKHKCITGKTSEKCNNGANKVSVVNKEGDNKVIDQSGEVTLQNLHVVDSTSIIFHASELKSKTRSASLDHEIEDQYHSKSDAPHHIITTKPGINRDLFGLELLGDKLIIFGGRMGEQDSQLTNNINLISVSDFIKYEIPDWKFIGRLSQPMAIYTTGTVTVKKYLLDEINFTGL